MRYKNVLDDPNESDKYKLQALSNLMQKKPAKEIIEKTEMGNVLFTVLIFFNDILILFSDLKKLIIS